MFTCCLRSCNDQQEFNINVEGNNIEPFFDFRCDQVGLPHAMRTQSVLTYASKQLIFSRILHKEQSCENNQTHKNDGKSIPLRANTQNLPRFRPYTYGTEAEIRKVKEFLLEIVKKENIIE